MRQGETQEIHTIQTVPTAQTKEKKSKGSICALIVNILVLILLTPICFFLESTVRPLAIVWIVLRQTDCSKCRQVVTLILSIVCIPIFFFLFGIWAFIQIILNLYKFFRSPQKYEVNGKAYGSYVWVTPHPLYKLVLDIFGAIRGDPLDHRVAG